MFLKVFSKSSIYDISHTLSTEIAKVLRKCMYNE